MVDLAISVAAFLFLAFVAILGLVFIGWIVVSIISAAQDENERLKTRQQPAQKEGDIPFWQVATFTVVVAIIAIVVRAF